MREIYTESYYRLAIFCIKIFATLRPQNASQIKIKEVLTLLDNFYIILEQFHEKTIYIEVER